MPLQLNNNDLTVALVLKADNLVGKGTREAKNDIKGLGNEAKKSAKDIESAYKNLGIRSRREIDREIRKMEASYKRLSHSGKLSADEEMRFMRAESDRLGLSLRNASADYAQMAAASKGTYLEGQKTRDIFKAVAEASAVMGLSAEDTSGAIRAINQMISTGTVSAEELRGQLGERLPGAFQIAARAMKVSTEDLGKMLEQGELMADEFLPRFGRQIRQELGDQVEAATERAAASFQRMSNTWFDFKTNVAKSGLLDSLADASEVGNEFARKTMAAFEGVGLVVGYASESLFAFGKEQERIDRVLDGQRQHIQEKYGLLKQEIEATGAAGATVGEQTAGGLDKALTTQHEKQTKLREKIFKAVGGAAGGYFRDQLHAIRQEAKEMLGASIAEADRLKVQMGEAAQAISKVAGNLREMLPPDEAQQIQARLDVLREQLQSVAGDADIQANIETLQALVAVKRIQRELAQIPREVVTVHRIVTAGAGPVPAPPKGSRALGGMIPDDGYYLMHKGERVVSQNNFGDFNFSFPSGSMSQTEARAFVRNVVIPELQAAGR